MPNTIKLEFDDNEGVVDAFDKIALVSLKRAHQFAIDASTRRALRSIIDYYSTASEFAEWAKENPEDEFDDNEGVVDAFDKIALVSLKRAHQFAMDASTRRALRGIIDYYSTASEFAEWAKENPEDEFEYERRR